MSEKVMIQSTCIQCGEQFQAENRGGMTRGICDPCRPIRRAENLRRWRAKGGKKYNQIRYRKTIKGLDKDYALIARMRDRQAEIDAEISGHEVQRKKAQQLKPPTALTAEHQQARADVAVALRRLGLGANQR